MSVLLILSLALAQPSPVIATPAAPAAIEDARGPLAVRIEAAAELVHAAKPAAALPIVDAVIVDAERLYPVDKGPFYAARSMTETLVYATLGVAAKKGTTVLNSDWATAYFLKGFALIDLGRADEAKPWFDKAIALSPMNSQFLGERGEWHKSRKDWANALVDFEAAQRAAAFSPDDAKVREEGRALRGIAFVKVEQGDFRGAEKLLKQALKLDRSDPIARRELDFVRSRK